MQQSGTLILTKSLSQDFQQEDIKAGRTHKAKNAEDMFQQILG